MSATESLTFRHRSDRDLPSLASMLQAVHETSGYPVNMPNDPERWLIGEGTQTAWVAALPTGRLIGHVARAGVFGDLAEGLWSVATGRPAGELAVVKRLFVDPLSQASGVGQKLLDLIVCEAHGLGLWPVLDVNAQSRRAKSFYEQAGFEMVGSREITWTGGGGAFVADCYLGPPPPVSSPSLSVRAPGTSRLSGG
ncbi:MAG: GNAT family N-acetyltransferase [Acidimicrobiales bacterium]